MPRLRDFIVDLAVMLAVGITLAAVGPFGSFGLGSFAARLAYWLPAAIAGYLFVRPTLVVARLVGRRLAIPEPPVLAAGILFASVPMTSFVLWLNGNPLTYLPSFEGWFQLYVQVALIGGLITLLFWLLERGGRAGSEVPEAPVSSSPAPRPAAFLDRLPPHLRAGLIALEMEDHYVRAHTEGGSTLVLLRMRDAVAELAGIEGMQVHRSWWVARSAVREAVSSGRSVTLLLERDIEAPVARSSIPALRAAGWLTASAEAPPAL